MIINLDALLVLYHVVYSDCGSFIHFVVSYIKKCKSNRPQNVTCASNVV